ncbi:MAG: hypothetical protein IPI87_14465 [Betaproteobacteria bacterium]|nr:hypothetical protein [Betaproteobacteria bacterium]
MLSFVASSARPPSASAIAESSASRRRPGTSCSAISRTPASSFASRDRADSDRRLNSRHSPATYCWATPPSPSVTQSSRGSPRASAKPATSRCSTGAASCTSTASSRTGRCACTSPPARRCRSTAPRAAKLFLATLPKTRRAALLQATPLDRHAPGTIVPIRQHWSASSTRCASATSASTAGYIAGLVAVAVPVRDRRGRVVAAIAVHAPAAHVGRRGTGPRRRHARGCGGHRRNRGLSSGHSRCVPLMDGSTVARSIRWRGGRVTVGRARSLRAAGRQHARG